MSDQEIWDGIEADYITGVMSVAEIAEKWGRPASTIYKKATKYGWKKKQKKVRQKADEIVIARRARARARELSDMYEATSGMSKLLKKTVAAMNEQPMDKVLKGLKGLSALASAMDTNVKTLMTLHGIQTQAQAEAQKIARERLALEKRKQDFVEGQVEEEQRDREVKLTISVRGKPDDGHKSGEAEAE